MEQGALPAEVLAEARQALAAWKLKDGAWRLVGTVPGSRGAVLRPVVEIGDTHYVLRRQPSDLTLADARFRHAFMAHLTAAGLPVLSLLPAADGHTWALVGDGVYELQTLSDGHPYLSSGVASGARLEAAAVTLGRMHQASADFMWEPHSWPEERSATNIGKLLRQPDRRRGGERRALIGHPARAGAGCGRLRRARRTGHRCVTDG